MPDDGKLKMVGDDEDGDGYDKQDERGREEATPEPTEDGPRCGTCKEFNHDFESQAQPCFACSDVEGSEPRIVSANSKACGAYVEGDGPPAEVSQRICPDLSQGAVIANAITQAVGMLTGKEPPQSGTFIACVRENCEMWETKVRVTTKDGERVEGPTLVRCGHHQGDGGWRES